MSDDTTATSGEPFAGHTPGPWRVHRLATVTVTDDAGWTIATVRSSILHYSHDIANAALIVAAADPDTGLVATRAENARLRDDRNAAVKLLEFFVKELGEPEAFSDMSALYGTRLSAESLIASLRDKGEKA